jgi:hypothetical protein
MSVYGKGLLLAVETLLVELLEDDDGTDIAEDDEGAAELLKLGDAGKTLDDIVGAAELLLLRLPNKSVSQSSVKDIYELTD